MDGTWGVLFRQEGGSFERRPTVVETVVHSNNSFSGKNNNHTYHQETQRYLFLVVLVLRGV